MRYCIILSGIFLLIVIPGESRGQGHFVNHGFRITAPTLTYSQNRSKWSIEGGYHVHRVLEFGLALEQMNDSRDGITRQSWSPYVAVYPFVQSGSMPVSVRLGLTFERQAVWGDRFFPLGRQGIFVSGRAYRLDAGISRNVAIDWRFAGRPVSLLTILFMSWEKATMTIGDAKEYDRLVSVYGDFLAVIDAGGKAYVMIGPRLGIVDDEPAVGFTFGITGGLRH